MYALTHANTTERKRRVLYVRIETIRATSLCVFVRIYRGRIAPKATFDIVLYFVRGLSLFVGTFYNAVTLSIYIAYIASSVFFTVVGQISKIYCRGNIITIEVIVCDKFFTSFSVTRCRTFL